jgi:hypothetical protein
MDLDRHDLEKRAEREREKAREKQHEREAEAQDKKGLGSPRPFWLTVIGVALCLFIVLYVWMVYVSPRAG